MADSIAKSDDSSRGEGSELYWRSQHLRVYALSRAID